MYSLLSGIYMLKQDFDKAFEKVDCLVTPVSPCLPFKLTGSQTGVIHEIITDMSRPFPMNRLLQGDVGSGKTVVAFIAAWVSVRNGYQVAFMGPTQLLAEQHFGNIQRLLEPAGYRVALLTSSLKGSERQALLDEVQVEPQSDVFLTLAQTETGVSCFLARGWLESGERNRLQLQRLKDKCGNRSNASSEVMSAVIRRGFRFVSRKARRAKTSWTSPPFMSKVPGP